MIEFAAQFDELLSARSNDGLKICNGNWPWPGDLRSRASSVWRRNSPRRPRRAGEGSRDFHAATTKATTGPC